MKRQQAVLSLISRYHHVHAKPPYEALIGSESESPQAERVASGSLPEGGKAFASPERAPQIQTCPN